MYVDYERERPFDTLIGLVLSRVGRGDFQSSYDTADAIFIDSECGRKFVLFHRQACCECVRVEEIVGNLNDLVNDGPVLLAEESSEAYPTEDIWGNSSTWTFYKLRTLNGDVTIRFLGTSNGYYSESVDFYELTGIEEE